MDISENINRLHILSAELRSLRHSDFGVHFRDVPDLRGMSEQLDNLAALATIYQEERNLMKPFADGLQKDKENGYNTD